MMRARFAELTKQFEERCLPVSVMGDQPESTALLPERYQKSFLSVDDRLESPPLHIMAETGIIILEWVYTIDLDRELFTVDETLHFKMTKIPRSGGWIKYIGEDGHDRRAFKTFTPKEIIGDVAYTPQISQASQDRYKELSPDVVPPKSLALESEESAIHREAFFWHIFSRAYHRFFSLLDQYYSEWDSGNFVFRELAFASLSIAAGEVSFEDPMSLNKNYYREGYFLIPEARRQSGQQPLLPLFLHETHAPGVEPGSAPKGTIYWMNNVLVHLVTRTDLVEVEEAAVADVVDFGLNSGAKNFYAVVFSILDVVLIHVQINQYGIAHVRRSPLMALIYVNDKKSKYVNGPRSRDLHTSMRTTTDDRPDEVLERKEVDDVEAGGEKDKSTIAVAGEYGDEHFTFTMMMRFFDAASKERLTGEKSRIFPNEIMSIIMDFADIRTYQALRKVSACCQQLGNRKIRLNDCYAVVGADRGHSAEEFLVEDLRTGEKVTLGVSYGSEVFDHSFASEDRPNLELSPIIGIADASNRITIIETISLCFPKLSTQCPAYKEQVESPFW